MQETLKERLLRYDHLDYLTQTYTLFCQQAQFVPELLQAMEHTHWQIAATWLLKHHCEQGACLSQEQVCLFYQNWSRQSEWQSQLHCLQLVALLPAPQQLATQTLQQSERWLQSSNKFVRAWCYNTLHLLAVQYPEFQAQVQTHIIRGQTEEAPSIRARLRKLV